MAMITLDPGPQEKYKHYRASINDTTYPATAQFTLTTFRARSFEFILESTTRTASFSFDGTNPHLVMDGTLIRAISRDMLHVDSIWIIVDSSSATIQINAWA